MPLKKLLPAPGVNRENTRYTNEGRWYSCDKVRFRQGTPEKIGGWQQVTNDQFLGVCRSLWPWAALGGDTYVGIGTNLKYYIALAGGGVYNDITPIRKIVNPMLGPNPPGTGNPFSANGTTTVTVTDVAHGCAQGDFVTFNNCVTGIASATIVSGGTGYTAGNTLTVSGGTFTSQAVLTVTSVSAGVITGVSVTTPGSYTVLPTSPVNVTGGSGSSATFNLTPVLPFNTEFQITSILTIDTYTITTASPVTAGSYGGAAVVATYQINVGDAVQVTLTGWGAGPWSGGVWGVGTTGAALTNIRIWNHYNFGEDLIFGPKDGAIYYWDKTAGLTIRGVALTSLPGASDVPTVQHLLMVSDASRFVLAFGCNDYGAVAQDPMLIRWSDQETAVNWTPAATTQAGSLRLSHGSAIEAVAQVRQEILVWTDVALYSLQYLGPPIVWGSQLLSDNISIISDRAWATAAGVTYWMGNEKFYMYDGRVQTLTSDLRQYIFSDFNFNQSQQVFAGTNEQFNEIWWFYCSANSTAIDRYVIYNYVEKAWYYGNLGRTAWMDTSVAATVPLAADYNCRLLYHETGVDDNATTTTLPIEAYVTSAEFDIDDGHNFGFVWRMLPDVNFTGSTVASPTMNLTLLPLQNSGSGYTRGITPVASVTSDMSVAGDNSFPVVRSATVPIDQFTGQVNIRVRGRQLSIKAASDQIGVQWQLGSCRIDVRPDGRKS